MARVLLVILGVPEIVAGRGGCASALCHGGTTKPLISGADADVAYAELTTQVAVSGHTEPYVDRCNRDPAGSAIVCNTSPPPAKSCGALMPLGSQGLAADDEQLVRAWIACGAPR